MSDGEDRLLEPLGVSDLEERVYHALLAGEALAGDELAEEIGTAPARTALALDTLVDLGLVARSPGPPVRFVAAPPEVAVEALIRRKEDDVRRARSSVAALSDEYHRRVQRSSDIFRLIEMVSDRATLRRCFLEFQRRAEREIVGFDVPPYASFRGTPNQEELDALARGVRYRIIYDPAAFEIPGMHELVESYVSAGEEARVHPGLPMKLTMIDSTTAVIPIESGARVIEGGLVLKESPLLRSLRVLFEQFWAQATPYPAVRGTVDAPDKRHAQAPSDVDRRILALLAAGQKDGAIARQIGLAQSTVERRVSRLLDSMGALSRFQAGVQAQRSGWLDAPPPP